jgi:single-stranded DNA-specific DHH superfamily exonuclease
MTVVAVNRELRARGFWTGSEPEPDLLGFLDLVALGTVADVVRSRASTAPSWPRDWWRCAGATVRG